jgi:hypothetical protein
MCRGISKPTQPRGVAMAWDESKAWKRGRHNQKLYQGKLEDARDAAARNGKRKKIIHPEDMPWELSPQGLMKHLLNEGHEHAHGDGGRLHADHCAGQPLGEAPAACGGVPVRAGGAGLRSAPGLRRGDHRHVSLEAAGRGEALRVGGGGRDLHSAQHDPAAFQRGRGAAGAADLGGEPDLQGVRAERPGAAGERA